ncbi:MAG: glycosyltransferase [Candidatus Eisenbacteria bacterium]|nr:glycosyltransferase [Candidatus Latescibacterota bacterium]MBD3302678.1 glycosyltransferase [Candidatus Eisenbacteria bacterium]
MPRVSVVVPTYNRCDCLMEMLRSALGQTFRDLELIVVDDGSTDGSAIEVLRQLGPDPERAESLWRQHVASATGTIGFGFWTHEIPLQYLYQPNRGIGAARNRGLQVAHGDLVAFLEPDHRWEARHLDRQVAFFDGNEDAWIAHGRLVVDRNGRAAAGKKRPTRSPLPISFEEIVGGNELRTSAIVAKKRCLDVHGGFDENLPACEDYDLWIRIAAHVPIYRVPQAVVRVKAPPSVPGWSLDRYRVYALEKAYQSGHLNAEQRHRVADELVARCDVLVEGYRKRNNTERANFYERKRKKFESEVLKLDMSDAAARTDPLHAVAAELAEEASASPAPRL